jgi:Flp pilus assembly protein TadB
MGGEVAAAAAAAASATTRAIEPCRSTRLLGEDASGRFWSRSSTVPSVVVAAATVPSVVVAAATVPLVVVATAIVAVATGYIRVLWTLTLDVQKSSSSKGNGTKG